MQNILQKEPPKSVTSVPPDLLDPGLKKLKDLKKKSFFWNTLLYMGGYYTTLWLKMDNVLFKLERTGWSDRQLGVSTMGVIGWQVER